MLPIATASPHKRIVRVGRTTWLCNHFQCKEFDAPPAVSKLVKKKYDEVISHRKKEINCILGSLYKNIPKYKESDITNMYLDIKEWMSNNKTNAQIAQFLRFKYGC